VLAPYFVIGAVHSGVSAVVTLMAILRKVFKWENYITPDHFDALGRLLVVVATAWLYFFILEFLFGLYSREQVEVVVREYQLGLWPNNILFGTFILTAYIIPVPLWLFRRVRRSITLMFWTSILVNVGMWMERFIIIIPALEAKQGFSFMYQIFTPSLVEVLLVLGSFGLVGTGLLIFAKFFPLIPLFDIKEGQVLKAEIQVGKVKVPAVIHE
jgi:molybdopterin-containing oxidoreductase family membrane subunit